MEGYYKVINRRVGSFNCIAISDAHTDLLPFVIVHYANHLTTTTPMFHGLFNNEAIANFVCELLNAALPDSAVLRGLGFHPGQLVKIVGPSRCGNGPASQYGHVTANNAGEGCVAVEMRDWKGDKTCFAYPPSSLRKG